jgi:hypothetical protein
VFRGWKDEGDLILLDELARLLEGLWGRVTIVDTDEVDLAPVDAAPIVDHRQIGSLGDADGPIGAGGLLYGMVWPILISVSEMPGA